MGYSYRTQSNHGLSPQAQPLHLIPCGWPFLALSTSPQGPWAHLPQVRTMSSSFTGGLKFLKLDYVPWQFQTCFLGEAWEGIT